MRKSGGRQSWGTWTPIGGMVGTVVHYWVPNHADPVYRSNVNQLIYLMKISDKYVPVSENGVKEYHQFTGSGHSVNVTPMGSEEEKPPPETVEEEGASAVAAANAEPAVKDEDNVLKEENESIKDQVEDCESVNKDDRNIEETANGNEVEEDEEESTI